jgi:hypothetical protein
MLFSKVQKERIRILDFEVAETDVLYFRKTEGVNERRVSSFERIPLKLERDWYGGQSTISVVPFTQGNSNF